MKLKMWLIPAALVGMMLWPFSVKAEEDTIHFSLNIDELTDENGYLQADDDAGDSTGLKYSVSMTGDSLSKTSFTDNVLYCHSGSCNTGRGIVCSVLSPDGRYTCRNFGYVGYRKK